MQAEHIARQTENQTPLCRQYSCGQPNPNTECRGDQPDGEVIERLRNAAAFRRQGGVDRRGLLDGFLRRQDAAALTLVMRHAPMVWGVPPHLDNLADAGDAFRPPWSSSARPGRRVGTCRHWLGVACQTARKARQRGLARHAKSRRPRRRNRKHTTQARATICARRRELGSCRASIACRWSCVTSRKNETGSGAAGLAGTVAGRLARAECWRSARLERAGSVRRHPAALDPGRKRVPGARAGDQGRKPGCSGTDKRLSEQFAVG